MKTYKLSILAFMVALTFNFISCNDNDFLKEETTSSYTIGNAFQVQSQVKDCVAKVQINYQNLRFGGVDTYWMITGLGTDIYDTPGKSGISSFQTWTSQNEQVEHIFNGYYSVITQANFALKGIKEVTWSDEELRKQCLGEAEFFRGISYLGLGELFGGVPLVLEFIQQPIYNHTRSTREETYQQAISDMEEACKLLKEHPGAGHPGKGVCETLLSEAYIALATIKGNDKELLQKAINHASNVMTYHSLMTKRFGVRANPSDKSQFNYVDTYYSKGNVFFDLFQRGNYDYEEGNSEGLWVKQSDYDAWMTYNETSSFLLGNWLPRIGVPRLRALTWRPEYKEAGAANGPFNSTLVDRFNLPLNISAYLGGRTQFTFGTTRFMTEEVWTDDNDIRGQYPNFRRYFEVQDPKHSLKGMRIDMYNVEKYITDNTSFRFSAICSKWNPIDDWGYQGLIEGSNNRTWSYNDVYYYRLAETYLLRAEAYYRLGESSEAAADINALRTRAQAKPITAGEVNLNYILDERARELVYEELRWNTLLRMGGSIPNDRIINHGKFTHDYKEFSGSYKGTLRDDFLFPIPQSFIDSNTETKIEQNPGWE